MPIVHASARNCPAVVVVLCTHTGFGAVFDRVIQSLEVQDLPADSWQLCLVLNGPAAELTPRVNARIQAKTLRLPEAGLTRSRLAGFRETQGRYYILVDDDTILAPDFLSRALSAMERNPEIGAAGGRIQPELPYPASPWLKPSLGNLAVRDFGDIPIASSKRGFGPWVPVGAGMVVTSAVAQRFVAKFESSLEAADFGRKGKSLQGGEDTILAFGAFDLGLGCAYFPELHVIHVLPASRLTRIYVARLNIALGRSHARVCRAVSWPVADIGTLRTMLALFRVLKRSMREFPSGWLLVWLWHLGFALESGRPWNWDGANSR